MDPERPSTSSSNEPDEQSPSSSPLDHWRQALAARREPRGGRGGGIIGAAKTLAWVVPLTLLIWIYAEREQVAVIDDVSVPLSLQTSAAGTILTFVDDQGHQRPETTVTVELRGPRAALDRVVAQIHSAPVPVPVSPTLRLGRQVISLDNLADQSVFADQGVSLRDPRPGSLAIDVDRIVERSLPVRAESDLETLARKPNFSPQEVKVRAPASLFARAADHVTAMLSGLPEMKQPGPHDIANVPITWDFHDEQVSFTPLTVQASIVVKQRNRDFTIPSLTIWPITPAGFLDKYRIDCPPRIANVTVSGPPDKIDLLAHNEFDAKARLEVSGADLPVGQDREKLPIFELPAGVVVTGDSAAHRVTFKVLARSGTE